MSVVKYGIHDNGWCPFVVSVNDLNVKIYSHDSENVEPRYSNPNPTDTCAFEDREYNYFKEYKALKVFIGKSRKKSIVKKKYVYKGEYIFIGNSILLELKNNSDNAVASFKYVYIGSEIYEFVTSEPIQEYFSLVGNSDVPYPVAIGTNYAYFFLDKKYIARLLFPKDTDWIDGYISFYMHTTRLGDKDREKVIKFKDSDIKGMQQIKSIHKRIW